MALWTGCLVASEDHMSSQAMDPARKARESGQQGDTATYSSASWAEPEPCHPQLTMHARSAAACAKRCHAKRFNARLLALCMPGAVQEPAVCSLRRLSSVWLPHP